MKRERVKLAVVLGALAGIAMAAAGCQTGKKEGDAGTSTGLPYRPPGTPTYTDLPSGFRTFPAAQPLAK
jgi:hypothetical protein